MKIRNCTLLIFLLMYFANVACAQEFRFTVVDSSATSWVARGFSDYHVTPADGWSFTMSTNQFDGSFEFEMTGEPFEGTEVDLWRLRFAAPFDDVIYPGPYEDMQRWPFEDDDRPGFDFVSTGRGDNRLSGYFFVHEATYDVDGGLLTFSADVLYFGEEDPNDFAILEFRYNVPFPAIEPDTLTVFRGSQIGGQLQDLLASDDSRISFRPGFTINDLEAPIWLILDGQLATDQPQDLELSLESQAGTPGLTCTIEAWNWNLNQYDVVSEFAESFNNDTITSPNLGAASSDYAENGTGAVRARLGWRQTGFIINFPWVVSIDHFNWSSN